MAVWTFVWSYDEVSLLLAPEDIRGGCSGNSRSINGSYGVQFRGGWKNLMLVLAGIVWDKRCLRVCSGRFLDECLYGLVSATTRVTAIPVCATSSTTVLLGLLLSVLLMAFAVHRCTGAEIVGHRHAAIMG